MYHPGMIRSRPLVNIVILLALTAVLLAVLPQGIQKAACCVYRICHAVEHYLLWRICPSLNNSPGVGTIDLSGLYCVEQAGIMG